MYVCAILSTLGAWVLGLVLDANIGFSPLGFLELRILMPVLAMGLNLLYRIKRNR